MDDEILAMCDQLELPTMVRPLNCTASLSAEPAIPAARRLQLDTRIDSFEHCSVTVSAINWYADEPESLVAQPSSDTDEEYDQVSNAYAKTAARSA